MKRNKTVIKPNIESNYKNNMEDWESWFEMLFGNRILIDTSGKINREVEYIEQIRKYFKNFDYDFLKKCDKGVTI